MKSTHDTTPSLTEAIRRSASGLGLALCRVTTADPIDCTRLIQWLAEGRHGNMRYMERAPLHRGDPHGLLTGARSVVCCALSYGERGISLPRATTDSGPECAGDHTGVARFARGGDYHAAMLEKLESLADEIRRFVPGARARCCVDTSPIMEKMLAARAGLGWIGRNCLLINPRLGSWFVLGEIITDVSLDIDAPGVGDCGDCRACLDACPTGALDGSSIDARKCISYLTIECRRQDGGSRDAAQAHSPNGYGCDICQEACPYNAQNFDVVE